VLEVAEGRGERADRYVREHEPPQQRGCGALSLESDEQVVPILDHGFAFEGRAQGSGIRGSDSPLAQSNLGPRDPFGGDRRTRLEIYGAVGDLVELREHVARDEDGLPLGGELPYEALQVDAGRRIEPGGGFVEQQDLRVVHERTGEGQLLLLATREHAGLLVREGIEPDQGDEFSGPARGLLVPEAVEPAGGLQRGSHGQHVPGAEGVRHPSQSRANGDRFGDGIEPRHTDAAGIRSQKGGEHEHQGRLAGAVRTDECGHRARRGVEVDLPECTNGAEGPGQIANDDAVCGHLHTLTVDDADAFDRLAGMLLSDHDIKAELDSGRVGLDPYEPSMIQPSSVDVRLDRFFRLFDNHKYPFIDPAVDQPELTRLVEMDPDEAFILHPGEFVLGSTYETVTLPDDLAARLEGKSSLGRLGLLTHSTAGFVDPGFSGHVTLELSNVATLPIKLWPGMKIGQLCFMRLSSPADKPYGSAEYSSRYQGQRGPTASRSFQNFHITPIPVD
jgi:dCTP deaminase